MRSRKSILSETRQGEILDAARRVFARRGFSDGIVDEIAVEAGMAKGTIYLYFKSKKDIYRAVLDHDMKKLKARTIEQMERAHGLKSKIHAFVLVRMRNADENREFFRIMDAGEGSLTLTRSQYRDYLAAPVSMLTDALNHAVERGSIRPVAAERVAWMIADMTRGAIQRRLLGGELDSLEEEATFIADFVMRACHAG